MNPADVNVSENHVWSLLLLKTFLSLKNFGENASKSSFFFTCNGAERNVTGESFENAASRANYSFILMSRNYVCYCARY